MNNAWQEGLVRVVCLRMGAETVTKGPISQDVSRLFGICLQFSPQLADYDAQIFKISVVVSLPNAGGEFLITDWLVSMTDKNLQDAEFLWCEVGDLAIRTRNLARFQI